MRHFLSWVSAWSGAAHQADGHIPQHLSLERHIPQHPGPSVPSSQRPLPSVFSLLLHQALRNQPLLATTSFSLPGADSIHHHQPPCQLQWWRQTFPKSETAFSVPMFSNFARAPISHALFCRLCQPCRPRQVVPALANFLTQLCANDHFFSYYPPAHPALNQRPRRKQFLHLQLRPPSQSVDYLQQDKAETFQLMSNHFHRTCPYTWSGIRCRSSRQTPVSKIWMPRQHDFCAILVVIPPWKARIRPVQLIQPPYRQQS